MRRYIFYMIMLSMICLTACASKSTGEQDSSTEMSDTLNASKVSSLESFRVMTYTDREEDCLSDIIANGESVESTYNFLSGKTPGLPLYFEFKGVRLELETDKGSFNLWDIEEGSGPVSDVGSKVTLDESGYVFLNICENTNITVTVYNGEELICQKYIEVLYDDKWFYLSMKEG